MSLLKKGHPRAHGTEMCPAGSGVSPGRDTPHPLRAACSVLGYCSGKRFFHKFRSGSCPDLCSEGSKGRQRICSQHLLSMCFPNDVKYSCPGGLETLFG